MNYSVPARCARMRGGLFRLDARLIERRLLAICEHHASSLLSLDLNTS
jgi:hypothetical protein